MISIFFLTVIFIINVSWGSNINSQWMPDDSQEIRNIQDVTTPSRKGYQNVLQQTFHVTFPGSQGSPAGNVSDHGNKSAEVENELKQNASRLHSLTKHGETSDRRSLDGIFLYERLMNPLTNVVQDLRRSYWTPERNADLLRISHQSREGPGTRASRLYEAWIKEHSEKTYINAKYLTARAGYLALLQKQQMPIKKKKIIWTKELKDELCRVYHENVSKGHGHIARIYKEWIEKHPEHRNFNVRHFQQRARKFANEQSKDGKVHAYGQKRIPWTRQLKADLLHIHYNTEPKKFNHTIRMYERWVKMHPEYKDQLLENLKELANRVKKSDFKFSEAEKEKARIQFDSLPPPAPPEPKKCKRKKGVRKDLSTDHASENSLEDNASQQQRRSLFASHIHDGITFDLNDDIYKHHMEPSNELQYHYQEANSDHGGNNYSSSQQQAGSHSHEI